MVVVVSDDYLQSKECDFQTKFALSLSPGKLSPALATEEWVGGASRCPPFLPEDQECNTKELLRVGLCAPVCLLCVHVSAFCVSKCVPGMLTEGSAVNPWAGDWSHPTVG